jgi:hypothetical protein
MVIIMLEDMDLIMMEGMVLSVLMVLEGIMVNISRISGNINNLQ